MRQKARTVALALAASGCTYTRAVTQTNVPAQRSQRVHADVSRLIVFATTDTDEVAQITARLQDKCPGGRVLGVTTKDLRTLYFLFIVWKREVRADGYCVRASRAEELPDAPEAS